MSAPQPVCATAARQRNDPLAGTAVTSSCWLLIEHTGRWDFESFSASGIDLDVRVALTEAVRAARARLVFIRRPGRRTTSQERAWAVIDDRDGAGESWGTWSRDADLLGAIPPLTRPVQRPAVSERTVLLVCTHGLHDSCCAVRGRPVAAELQRRWPEETWECSHIGGDRFAANVIVLPSGTYYGNVEPEEAVRVVTDHLSGHVDAERLRGFGGELPPAQAAVIEAHRRYGPAGARDIRSTAVERLGPDRWRISLTGLGGVSPDLDAIVTAIDRAPALLTCQAHRATSAREYVVERLAAS